MANHETKPIRINDHTIGDKESNGKPFESHAFDFAHINEHLARNPATRRHVVPDAMVSSCSECCMDTINGRQNTLGYLFRKSREPMGCHLCPVAAASELLPARDAEGNYMLNENNEILSEADVIRMAEDGEK